MMPATKRRRRELYARRREAGYCVKCGVRPVAKAGLSSCDFCILKKRTYRRLYAGSAPWKPGRPGRPLAFPDPSPRSCAR